MPRQPWLREFLQVELVATNSKFQLHIVCSWCGRPEDVSTQAATLDRTSEWSCSWATAEYLKICLLITQPWAWTVSFEPPICTCVSLISAPSTYLEQAVLGSIASMSSKYYYSDTGKGTSSFEAEPSGVCLAQLAQDLSCIIRSVWLVKRYSLAQCLNPKTGSLWLLDQRCLCRLVDYLNRVAGLVANTTDIDGGLKKGIEYRVPSGCIIESDAYYAGDTLTYPSLGGGGNSTMPNENDCCLACKYVFYFTSWHFKDIVDFVSLK